MKATDLMIGDWVIRKGVPEEPMRVYDIKTSVGTVYLDQDGRGIIEKFENIEPIPLTSEILKKNEFKKNIYYYSSHSYETYLLPKQEIFIGYHIIKWFKEDDWTIIHNIHDDDDYGFDYDEVITIQYVHELQHILKLCKIEKEIIL